MPDGRGPALPPGPVVKICGLTRVEDVRLACDLGAWALGFVFAPSRRRLTPAAARGLIAAARDYCDVLPAGSRAVPDPLAIGVFGDAAPEEIALIVDEAGLDGVQLHGLAGPRADEVRAAVGRRERPLLIIKALPVAPDAAQPRALAAAAASAAAGEQADTVLLDTKTMGGFGGSGKAFPWSLAREAAAAVPLLVAGGIGPGNVRAALGESGAWGVDVSSGVELSVGVKDAGLLTLLFAEVRAPRRTAIDELQEGPQR